jgi:hypothetical protein
MPRAKFIAHAGEPPASPIDRARRYLAGSEPAVAGNGGHNQLFAVTHGLRKCGLSKDQTRVFLREYNERCDPPWTERELEHKLSDVFDKVGKLPAYQTPTPRAAEPKVAPKQYDVPDSLELPNAMTDATRTLLRIAFREGEHVRIALARTGADGREVPKDAGETLTREEWIARLDKHDGNPNGFLSTPAKNGIFITINPMRAGGTKDADVTDYRHALLEFDDIDEVEQWGIITGSNVPCVAVISSGGRSIHAWVKVEAANRTEYDERVKALYSHFAAHEPDEKCRNPSRFSRLPGCERGSRRQELLGVNIGAPDWATWERTLEAQAWEKELAARAFDATKEPPPVQAVYTLAGTIVCTPGNLTTITSGVKTGKTAVIGAMASSAMANGRDGLDLLGFASANPAGRALLWFDSEQAPDDFWYCVTRAIRRAGLEKPPPWFHAYCLTGLHATEAWLCVCGAFKVKAAAFGGIHSALLDGAADFVNDVNDAAECNGRVADLHAMAIQYECPIVGAIHFNPGSEKSRGHLGSQLERKAESNLRLDKEDDFTVIWSDKQRRAPISKLTGPCFAWSDQLGMHVSTASRKQRRDEVAKVELAELAESAFAGHPARHYAELVTELANVLKKCERTARRKVKDMINLGVIRKTVANLYEIAR